MTQRRAAALLLHPWRRRKAHRRRARQFRRRREDRVAAVESGRRRRHLVSRTASPSMIQIELDRRQRRIRARRIPEREGHDLRHQSRRSGLGRRLTGALSRRSGRATNGTTIVLLGSEEAPDTILGNPKAGENDIKGLSVYLNSRFWDLTQTEVMVVELRSERKTSWPTGPEDRDDARRPNNRRIMGAKYYLADIAARTASSARRRRAARPKPRAMRIGICGRASGPRSIHTRKSPATSPSSTRTSSSSSRPTRRTSAGSASPTRRFSRTSLSFWSRSSSTRRSECGACILTRAATASSLPAMAKRASLSRWPTGAIEFSEHMPEEIREAILKARGEGRTRLEDEEYRKRLQDKFGNRWITTQTRAGKQKARTTTSAATPTNEERAGRRAARESRTRSRSAGSASAQRRIQVIHLRASAGGNGQGVERQVAVDVPQLQLRRQGCSSRTTGTSPRGCRTTRRGRQCS